MQKVNGSYDKTNPTNLKNPLSRLAYTLAKITLRFNLVVNELIELYKFHLVMLGRKQNPDYSIVELSARVGLDRRFVSHTLNKEELKKTNSKIKLVLQQVRHMCVKNNTDLIAKQGGSLSFKAVCQKLSSGSLTYNAIAKELLRQEEILDQGRKYQLVNLVETPIEDSLGHYYEARSMVNEMIQFCLKNNTKYIAKYGECDSFESIYKKLKLVRLTARELANHLIESGNIIDEGESYQLINWRASNETDDGHLDLLTIEIDRITGTIIENSSTPTRKKRKLQRTTYSSQIKPEHYKIINLEIYDFFDKLDDKITNIFIKFDEAVPINTYPVFGLSIFTFGPDHN